MKIYTTKKTIAVLIILNSISCTAQVENKQDPKSLPLKHPDSFAAKVDQLFSQERNYQRLSGVLLVGDDEGVIVKEAYGGEDRGINETVHTRFDIGSITKQFTAAAILHLVNEGKFQLTDPINSLLGSMGSERWEKVTVHQLLTHTSGIPSIYQTEQGIDIFFPKETPIALEDLIDTFRHGKLLFKPEEEFSYSNSGYVLLAAIIQQVSGGTYKEFMEQFFSSYGLSNTSFEADNISAQPYYGYRQDLAGEAPRYHHSWSIGAGGVYATVDDLSRWISIIRSDTFLTDDLRSKFLQRHTGSGYGYGWVVDRSGYLSHDGGTAGFTSLVRFDPQSGYRVVLLTNRGHEDVRKYGKNAEYVNALVDKTWMLIKGEEVDMLPEITSVAMEERKYRITGGSDITLKMENDTAVWVTVDNGLPSRLVTNTSLSGQNTREQLMIDLADYLKRKKYWSMAKHCDGEMKFVCYSGLMSIGMKMIKGKTGKIQEIWPYYVEDQYGLIRIKGEKTLGDVIVYFDTEGKVTGLFEHGYYDHDYEAPMLAFPFDQHQLYLDGINEGESDLTIEWSDSELVFWQYEREVRAVRVKSN